MTAANLQKEPDDKDILKGVAFGLDKLHNTYFGKSTDNSGARLMSYKSVAAM
jgi:hypothetical protein